MAVKYRKILSLDVLREPPHSSIIAPYDSDTVVLGYIMAETLLLFGRRLSRIPANT